MTLPNLALRGALLVSLVATAHALGQEFSSAASIAAADEISVDADFPGGNIVVERIEGRTVFVAPDQRDIQPGQWWFSWSLRLRAPAAVPVTVTFTEQNPLGVRGPAESCDGGATWRWLGAGSVRASREGDAPAWSFTAVVPEGHNEVRYAFCPHYLESHLRAWLARDPDRPSLRVERLCLSRQGREVQMIRAGCLDPQRSRGVILLTARHHACEAMANYAMEGFLDAVLADDELGRRWRDTWEVVAVPFMDQDGVEAGDSGKYRSPHDHNRDYTEQPLYPEVAALSKLGAAWGDRVVATMDLHCPHIRGTWNDRAYFVGSADPGFWAKQQAFAAILERVRSGPIGFTAADGLLPFGTAWNTGGSSGPGRSCSAWARDTFPRAALVNSLELAYADALGVEVTADSARAFGRDLARAMAEYLAAG